MTKRKVTDRDILASIAQYRKSVNYRHGPPSLAYLGKQLGVSKGTLSPRIRALEEKGYLYGTSHRGYVMTSSLALTAKGLAHLTGDNEEAV